MELTREQKERLQAAAISITTSRYAIECMQGHTFNERLEYARTGDLPKSSKTLKW